jgi:ACS family tartrate transporter-like MFS transporter
MSEQQIFAKCAWRLIPLMVAAYLANFIDRVNVGFAALTMNKDLGFSPSVYGFGAGVLFVAIVLFQVPANVMLERVGARRWFFSTMLIWGAISASTAFVQTPASFYVLRFLLGMAEAAFLPGMLFYLTLWFPQAYRARYSANFMLGVPLSFVIGAPLSGLILGMDGAAGLHGWQWLFLLEGLPTCLLAFAIFKLLPDGPANAPWLTAEEKALIASRLSNQQAAVKTELWPALRDPRVIVFGVVLLGHQIAAFGFDFWLPQIVRAMGFSIFVTGFVVALPYAVSMPAMVLWGRSSDRRGERIWHVVLAAVVVAAGFAVASVPSSALIGLLGLIFVRIGLSALYGPFWSLTSSFLRGPAAAGGIALITCIGNGLGGFLGPNVIGILRQQSGSYTSGMIALALGMVFSAFVVLALGRAMAPRRAVA